MITGGCGFIGHHLVDTILKTTDWRISIFDALTYASRGMDRLMDIGAFNAVNYDRVRVYPLDLSQPIHNDVKKELGEVDYIVHMAAEVHVDKSIADPRKFVNSNIFGTYEMLQLAREIRPGRFLYFSTDEVFGPALDGVPHKEWDRYNSSNPYAATKAAGEELTLAWANTYEIPIIVTHCTNVFGERQNPEAFIPATILKILNDETVRIHTNKKGESGSRFYIHAQDVARAILFLLRNSPRRRDKFNITGVQEVSNFDLATEISRLLCKKFNYDMVDSDRPGCDFRYGLDGTKMRLMGWAPTLEFSAGLKKTVDWYSTHSDWLTRKSAAVFGGRRK